MKPKHLPFLAGWCVGSGISSTFVPLQTTVSTMLIGIGIWLTLEAFIKER